MRRRRTFRNGRRRCLCWILVAFAPNLISAPAQDSLKSLQLEHSIALEKLQVPFDKLLENYLKHLGTIETSYQEAGDLDAVLLARQVKEAAQENPDTTAAVTQKLPAELAKAISTYHAERAKRQQAKTKQLLAHNRSYHKNLVALRKELTIAGETEQAIAVGELAKEIGTSVEEGELHARLDSGANVVGRFFSLVDGTASFYINGRRVHNHPRAGKAASEPVSLKVGDTLFIGARDFGSGGYLKAVFITNDGKFVLSLNPENTRVAPDQVKPQAISTEQFATLTQRPVRKRRNTPDGLEIQHQSEWMWEKGTHALFVAKITSDMFAKAFPKSKPDQ